MIIVQSQGSCNKQGRHWCRWYKKAKHVLCLSTCTEIIKSLKVVDYLHVHGITIITILQYWLEFRDNYEKLKLYKAKL